MHSHGQELMSQLPAGKFEFPDMGIYIGEWFENKAVGLGLMTREKGQGEYTGYWNNGKEECGVFLWPNAPGAMYEGDWAHSKRHGFGIFRKEDYIIMGEFKDDIIRTGISCREGTSTKFEGDFKEGLPVFGVETYPDGGTYCGEYESAKRHGFGKRTSIPYGEMLSHYPDEAARWENRRRRDSLTSQGSAEMPVFSFNNATGEQQANVHMTPLSGRRAIRSNAPLSQTKKFRCGFVLPGNKSDRLVERLRKADEKRARGKSHSLSSIISHKIHKNHNRANPFRKRGGEGSFRSAYSIGTTNTIGSAGTGDWQAEDPIEPETIECYSGEWVQDERHGYGVCKRTDGVIYEGQWVHNLRHGYGVTHFPDGTVEAGRYHEGQLTFLAGKRNPLLFMYTFPINKTIEAAVRRARDAEKIVEEKYREAQAKLAEVRDKVLRAKASAAAAREYSLETRELVKELYPHFEQPGIRILEATVKMMKVTKRISTAFETALSDGIAVLSGEHVFFQHDDDNHHGGDGAQKSNVKKHCDSIHKSAGLLKRSRHGSFRSSFRHNRRPGGDVNANEPGQGVSRQQAIKVRQAPIKNRKKRTPTSTTIGGGQNTLMVPNDPHSLQDGDDVEDEEEEDVYDSRDQLDEPDYSMKYSRPTSNRDKNTLYLPGSHCNGSQDGENEYTTDQDGEEILVPEKNLSTKRLPNEKKGQIKKRDSRKRLMKEANVGEHGRIRTDSDESSNVVVEEVIVACAFETVECEFPLLKPQSDIPTVPFSQLLDSTILSDHFDFYADNLVSSPPVNSAKLPTGTDLTTAITFGLDDPILTATTTAENKTKGIRVPPLATPSPRAGAVQSESKTPKLTRTSTLPSLLTCKPVSLMTSPRLRSGAQIGKLDESSTDTLLSPNPDASKSDKPIYLIQNGIRKKMTPLNTPETEHREKSLPVSNNRQNMTSLASSSSTGNTDFFKLSSTPLKSSPGPNSIELQPVQDELTPLSKVYVAESELDLRKDLGEGSLPDISVWNRLQKDMGRNESEIRHLADSYKEEQKRELERRRQGEIIIYTTGIVDWCYNHRLMIFVFLVNAFLTYILYIIVSHNPEERP